MICLSDGEVFLKEGKEFSIQYDFQGRDVKRRFSLCMYYNKSNFRIVCMLEGKDFIETLH